MNKNVLIRRLSKNIWKVTRYNLNLENRSSLFVQDLESEFENNSYYSACLNNELAEFYLENRMVLSERITDSSLSFKINPNDAIYGLGLHQYNKLNRRNSNINMLQINGRSTAIPFLTSTGGYAILIDTAAYMNIGIDMEAYNDYSFELPSTAKLENTINIYAEDSDELTYYVILGSFDEQIRAYRELTGKAIMLPKWAYGFFQSKEHYHTQEQILETAHRFRDNHIPIDCIVQDWNYWGEYGWNAVRWDPKQYPNPKAMVDEIHSLDMKLMVSVWPSFAKNSDIGKELVNANAIIEDKEHNVQRWGVIHDPYNPKAQDIVWNNMNKEIFSLGADAWWLDSTEPGGNEDNCSHLRKLEPCYIGSNIRYLNSYALASAKNIYLKQREDCSDKRVYILTRSGYASQQKYATTTWTGDIGATWDCLHRQINSLLSFSMSGLPYSTTDIGAFFVDYEGGSKNPEYRELYTRWFWFGLFSPLFRSHGTSTPREIWNFGNPGEEYYDSILKATRIRYALMPYLYSLAFDVYKNDKLFIKPLAYSYPNDKMVYDIDYAYMLGDSLLIVNVCEYKKRSVDMYLPKGKWFDLFTGKALDGGRVVTLAAPIDRIPVLVKAGSILLTTKVAECTEYQDNSEIEVRIYSGANASCFYYDDNGNNYDYENGDYLIINLDYNDNFKSLRISSPIGNTNFRIPRVIKVYFDNELKDIVSYAKEETIINLK